MSSIVPYRSIVLSLRNFEKGKKFNVFQNPVDGYFYSVNVVELHVLRAFGDHPFSTYTKFSEKRTYLTP